MGLAGISGADDRSGNGKRRCGGRFVGQMMCRAWRKGMERCDTRAGRSTTRCRGRIAGWGEGMRRAPDRQCGGGIRFSS